MYFSEELYNALKYGYKFEILYGYTFNKANVFNNYVDNLYNLRLQYPKSDPMNTIAKFLMNSLYGRFGRAPPKNDNLSKISILTEKEYNKFEKKHIDNLVDVIDLDGHYLLEIDNNTLNNELNSGLNTSNVNVAISAAITAYARIHMTQFKNLKGIKLFYSDTDSVYTNKPLPRHLISDTILGKLKLERICN